ncbi:epoxide hydrolase family protein [Saccharothrix syringae]|uniref:Epoxide hydrolase n=1 Tax=Saccharothrix syringae TaxID=103733 RepID=A0A5Q0H1K7_SACSY|nr:epoxide hydrolase family protein [Saccharothrix syringae]QFZ19734.1 epoxide hydrolase [Saccharothrix syringae]
MSHEIRPFRIDVPQAELDDLHTRLANTRWSRPLPGGWDRGVPVEVVREFAEHWRTGFDWRAREAELNGFPQYLTEIDGTEIHFLHVRSPRPDALPLLLTHGWPNSFVEFVDLVGHLTPDFHVVVPSVPGFGFSGAPTETGWDAARVARLWARLMDRLGYAEYGTQGGDFGAYVAPEVAKVGLGRVVGVYVISGLGFPTADDELTGDEQRLFAELMNADWMHGVDHLALLRSAPQTFAHGWHDSPVGALAWMLQKFHDFNSSDRPLAESIDRDRFLTNLSIHWFTGTSGTSAWPYYDSSGPAWPVGQRSVPTGVYSGPPGIRRLAERTNDIVHWPEHNPAGHHFIAMDQPAALAADLREFFAKVR